MFDFYGLHNTIIGPPVVQPSRPSFLVFGYVCDWSGGSAPILMPPHAPAQDRVYGWATRGTNRHKQIPGSAATHRCGLDSHCLHLQQGPSAMGPGLRQWAQPDKMQGVNSGFRTYARASYGCSRPRTAQQLLAIIAQVESMGFRAPHQLTEPQPTGHSATRASIEDTIACDRSGIVVACT